MNIKKETQFYQFCLPLLQSLHIDLVNFFLAVKEKREYEYQLYQWIIDLYEADVSFDESIKFLYKARNQAFLHNKTVKFPYKKKEKSDFVTCHYLTDNMHILFATR